MSAWPQTLWSSLGRRLLLVVGFAVATAGFAGCSDVDPSESEDEEIADVEEGLVADDLADEADPYVASEDALGAEAPLELRLNDPLQQTGAGFLGAPEEVEDPDPHPWHAPSDDRIDNDHDNDKSSNAI